MEGRKEMKHWGKMGMIQGFSGCLFTIFSTCIHFTPIFMMVLLTNGIWELLCTSGAGQWHSCRPQASDWCVFSLEPAKYITVG